MSRILFALVPILVIAWTWWGAIEYRHLKQELQAGRREALLREYRITIAGEVLFGVLSILAVGTAIMQPAPNFRVTLPAVADGLVIGVTIGMVISLFLTPLLARLKGGTVTVGDISALLPRTLPERRLFAVVAICAGLGEELLFRGFGIRLFEHAGLTGMTLLIVAAFAFGLAHVYQGVMGVVGTSVIGLVLGLAYIKTGNLLVPMALHALLDLRILTLPITREDKRED